MHLPSSRMTGVAGDIALVQSILVGVVNLLFTLIAVWLVDKVGRKILLLCGSLGMGISLLYLVYTFVVPAANGIGALIAVLCYIGFFCFFTGTFDVGGDFRDLPFSYSWNSYVTLHRNQLVMYFSHRSVFPWILNNLGGSVAFGIFAIFSIAAFAFILFCVPETKGKSLEAIEKSWEWIKRLRRM